MADQVREVMLELEGFCSKLTAKIALDVHANLVQATPVDTGWARANWVPAIGRAAGPDQPETKPSPGELAGAGAQAQAGIAQLAGGYKIAMGRIFVSNGVPYIQRLNDGWSQQAPAGFVERAIDKALHQDILSLRTA